MIPMIPSLGLLQKNTLFRNFFAASTVSLTGSGIFDVAMPLYVYQKTHSVIALALVSVCLQLPYFILAPVTGYLADHFNKRMLMIASDIGQIGLMLFILMYDILGLDSVTPMLIAIFAAKSLMVLYETVATFQLVPSLVSREDLSEANAWTLSAHRTAQILGPLMGGALMALSGIRLCIFVNTLSFAATLFYTMSMKNLDQLITGKDPSEKPAPISVGHMMQNFTESIKFIWQSPVFKPFVALMFLWNLSPLTRGSPSMTYYFTVTHHYNPAQYGTVIALFGVFAVFGFLASSLVYKKFSFSITFSKSFMIQAAVGTLACFSLLFPQGFITFYAFACVASSMLSMGTFMIRQTMIPIEKSGAINSTLRMLFMSAAPLSSFFQGFLLKYTGVGISFFFGVLCFWGASYYAQKLCNTGLIKDSLIGKAA